MFQLPKFGKHLHDKVLFILFLVGIIPLVILGILALYNLNLFHRIDVASIENNLINQKSEEISGFVQEISDSFNLQVGYEQTVEPDLVSQIFLLSRQLEDFPALEEVSFVALSGKETSRLNKLYPEGVPEYELQDQGIIEKFTKARDGNFYIGPVYYTLKGPMVTLSSPVKNKNGVIVSVLTGEFNLSGLQDIVAKSRLGETGYVYVVDRDGFLIAHSRKDSYTLDSLKLIKFVGTILEEAPVENISNRYTSLWSEPVVAEGKYLNELGFAIIAEWPTDDADKVVTTVRNQIIIASLLVLAGTLLLSFLFTKKIVGPIKTLEKGTQLIAEGKFDQPIVINTGDELEELGLAFNKMTGGLKHLEELKNEFIFIAAHELKTPVAVIKGYLSLMLNGSAGPLSNEAKEMSLKIASANQRLIQLVNDLLQIGRAEAGRLEIKVTTIDIKEPVKLVIREMKLLAEEKKIEIIYQENDNLPKVLADDNRLKEIMTNLISNAIKYNVDSGKVIISHKVEGSALITSITDTGMGISKKDQEKLFEKFYRIKTEKTENISGTGLGLFIVKQIIEKMNGKIWVDSEEGKGSTFSFSLSLVK